MFLDADDVLTRHAVEVGVIFLSVRPSCAFVSGDYRLVGTNLKVLRKAASPLVENATTISRFFDRTTSACTGLSCTGVNL